MPIRLALAFTLTLSALAPLPVSAPARAQSTLVATPAAVTLAPGGRATIALAGASGAVAATVGTAAVTVAVDPATQSVTVLGRTIGDAVVHVSDSGGANVDIPVQVLPPAGLVPARVRLTITGDPASAEFVAGRIRAAVSDAAQPTLAPGAVVRAETILPAPQPLASGFLTGFTVPVSIDPGAGTAAVAGLTAVEVDNAALPPISPVTLAFKDDPERITADGVLSRTTVAADGPTRLYYYHENMGERRRFCVVLSANASVMTHVAIVGAAAGPDIDVMSVGHAATKTFLTREPRNEGSVLAILGGKPVLERDTPLGPGDGIVDSIDLRVLDGGPVTATIMAIPLAADPAAYLYAAKLPDDGHARHGAFELSGYAQRIIAYSAGGRDASYVYGTRLRTPRNADPADPGRDYGDYGVLQRVTFDLDNPAGAPVTLYLYEKPLGGAMRGSFLVNGALVESGCVRVPQRYLIASYALQPHATGAFDVLTMTDGGSNAPLEIGVTGVPPLPAAPPIGAPEGCFPKPGAAAGGPQPGAGPAGH
jgi:hypothetical protein